MWSELQARNELHELLAKPSLVGIPLLVLGNKNDLPTALSTNELIDRLELKVHIHPDTHCLIPVPLVQHLTTVTY